MDDLFPPNFHIQADGLQSLRDHIKASLARRFSSWRSGARWQPHIADADARLSLALAVMRKHLELFRDLCEARNIRLTFVAQPLLTAMAKPLSAEEAEISAIQRRLGAYEPFALWGLYFTVLRTHYPTYCGRLGAICRELKIGFADLNEAPNPLHLGEWLFADQAHFTDAGCRIAAQQLLGCLAVRQLSEVGS